MSNFPYKGYHFGVFFLFPKFNFNASFKTVAGLSFSSTQETLAEGGIAGFSHHLTNRGTYSDLTLERGFTADKALYDWCESTHNTMKTEPCDILISLLDNNSMPVKNWLVFHAIPKSWKASDLDVASSSPMMESVTLSYKNFILI